MKGVRFDQHGGIDVLRVAELILRGRTRRSFWHLPPKSQFARKSWSFCLPAPMRLLAFCEKEKSRAQRCSGSGIEALNRL